MSRSSAIQISVVVPVRNEEKSVRTLIEGLIDQTWPPNEIVITDGGSTDSTREIIEEFISNGAPVTLIRETASLPGRARNIGARHCRNDWIAFTDAGNKLGPSWLATLAERVCNDETIDVVYGGYEPVVDTFFTECAAIAYVSPKAPTPDGLVRPRSIASALMRKQVWDEVGGFPEQLRSAEDLLFMNKIEAADFRVVRAPAALVRWYIQPTMWKTFRRFVVYARNNMRAGLWRDWQAAVFRRCGLVALTAVPAIFLGVKWLSIPLFLWAALMLARALKALYLNRQTYPAGWLRNMLRVLLLVPIISVLDLAALTGTISWLLLDRLRLSRNPG